MTIVLPVPIELLVGNNGNGGNGGRNGNTARAVGQLAASAAAIAKGMSEGISRP